MKTRVSVSADQITQWWDGYVCDSSPELRKLPKVSRYCMTLIFLEQYGILKSTGRGDEDLFEVDDAAPAAWRAIKLRQSWRRLNREIKGVSSQNMMRYCRALKHAFSRKGAIRECGRSVGCLLEALERGVFEVRGWNKGGRLEFIVTDYGAKILGSTRGEVFLSAIPTAME